MKAIYYFVLIILILVPALYLAGDVQIHDNDILKICAKGN